mmetsp:Transcript_122469/g.224562  ORF Transcript_122469/g.224562 Transcript_122469/m.224562 type:complete len:109 (+) Transcript_122469:3-329(+)
MQFTVAQNAQQNPRCQTCRQALQVQCASHKSQPMQFTVAQDLAISLAHHQAQHRQAATHLHESLRYHWYPHSAVCTSSYPISFRPLQLLMWHLTDPALSFSSRLVMLG